MRSGTAWPCIWTVPGSRLPGFGGLFSISDSEPPGYSPVPEAWLLCGTGQPVICFLAAVSLGSEGLLICLYVCISVQVSSSEGTCPYYVVLPSSLEDLSFPRSTPLKMGLPQVPCVSPMLHQLFLSVVRLQTQMSHSAKSNEWPLKKGVHLMLSWLKVMSVVSLLCKQTSFVLYSLPTSV